MTYNQGSTQYYDRYNNHDYVLFDNWSGQLRIDDAMNMFDPKQLRNRDFTVWVKGASVMFCAKGYFMCSVGGLKSFAGWQNCRERWPEWKRRVLRINVDHVPAAAKRDTLSAWQFVYACWDAFTELNKLQQSRARAARSAVALTSSKNPLNKLNRKLAELKNSPPPVPRASKPAGRIAAAAPSANPGTRGSLLPSLNPNLA